VIPRILLIDDYCDLQSLLKVPELRYQAAIGLFWASLETKRLMSESFGGICYCLDDVIKDIGFLEMEVAEFVRRVCDEGPKYKGIPLRRYLSEELFRAGVYPKVFVSVLNFLETLRKNFGEECLEIDLVISEEHSNILNQLDSIKELNKCLHFRPHPNAQALSQENPQQMSLTQRLRRQLQGATITGQWGAQIWNVIEKLDRDYKKRCLWNYFQNPRTVAPRPITFFSSYLNNSRILQAFEGFMPYPVHWLVTNHYARTPISNRTKLVDWIWSFGNPRAQGMGFKDGTILDDLKSHLNGNNILKAWASNSRILRNWTNGHLTSLMNLTYYWEHYLEKVRPRLVVTANQWGIEGWFSEIAKKRGIPVMQIMHGVMGVHFYTETSIISDVMVVPGEFWRNLWSEHERHKIFVFNPPGLISRVKKDQTIPKRVLTYFSWPLHKLPFYSSSELTNGFIDIFHRLLAQEGCEILVRCHPLENPSDFVGRWKVLHGSLPTRIRISKHEPLDCVLAETDVALMFRSTVMLNCLVNDIPVVMPGWINFGWNESLTNNPSICLANDFGGVELRIEEWLVKPPATDQEMADHFVQSPGFGRDAFCSLVRDLVDA
jgi:hypothetical protein